MSESAIKFASSWIGEVDGVVTLTRLRIAPKGDDKKEKCDEQLR